MNSPEVLETTVTIRRPNPNDTSFIFNSWLKSFRNSDWARPMHNNVYFTAHHALVTDLLNHSDTFIACSKKNPSEIFGYAVGQRIDGVFTLHYIYVKHTYRQLGIGSLLMSCFGRAGNELGCYTHHNHAASKLSEKANLLYNPYLLTQIDKQKEVNADALDSAINNEEVKIEEEVNE